MEAERPTWVPVDASHSEYQIKSRWRSTDIGTHRQTSLPGSWDCGNLVAEMKKRRLSSNITNHSVNFIQFWNSLIHGTPSQSRISNSVTQLYFLLLFLLLVGSSGAFCPPKCVCNDETLQASCEDAGLEVVPIQLNPDVKAIYLPNNKINNVVYTLDFYKNLRTLDVSRNRISSLGDHNFKLQDKLVNLNVSGNFITNLSKETFKGLKSLRVLDLSENSIENLDAGVWGDLPDLSELNLARNKILSIADGVFDPLKNLRILKLEDNQILEIPTSALRRLPSLRTLTLSDNLIESVNEDAIPALRDLRVLTLQGNVISSIHRSAFDGLQSLEQLDLSDNNLTTVPTSQLSKLVRLRDLHLSGNGFPLLGPVAFQSLFELRRLRLCRLHHLRKIDVRTFVDNIRLETVALEDNPALDTLPTRLFHGNPALAHLMVRGNAFESLDASHFPLDRLQTLHISDNPLHCNCSMLWLWVLTRKQVEGEAHNLSDVTPRLDVNEIRCAQPEALRDYLMVDVPESDVSCDASWLAVIIVTVVVLALFALTCGVLLFLGNNKWCKKKESMNEVHAHHHHQNGAVLMLMTNKDNMDGMDDFMLKTKDPMTNDMQYQHNLATWDSINKENGVTDPRSMDVYSKQYTINGTSKKPTHIVYV